MYFGVALGGALGSVARYWMGVRITVLAGLAFPWATILINILGSLVLVIGFLATLTGPQGLPAPLDARAFLIVGLCGFTTFSAFSLQTLELARDGRLLYVGANILLSVVLGVTAVDLGHWLATLFGKA